MRALLRMGDRKELTYTSSYELAITKDDLARYMIRVNSCSLTRGELNWPEPMEQATPIPGYDLAGTIQSGLSVDYPPNEPSKFKPMDKVYGFTTFSGLGNARAVAVAAESELALMPTNISWEEAAAVPLSALSAWQALFVHGGLTPPSTSETESTNPNEGKRVLVTAASGGVGIWGVQLAHQAGATVVGTCGTSNVDFVKSLGADTVLDYTTTSLSGWTAEDGAARGFDVVLDCIGGGTLMEAWKCVRRCGRVVSVAENPLEKRPSSGVSEEVVDKYFIVEANGEQLGEVTKLIEQGRCRGVVDSVFDLEEWKRAFEKSEGGHAKGKVVLKVDRGRGLEDIEGNKNLD